MSSCLCGLACLYHHPTGLNDFCYCTDLWLCENDYSRFWCKRAWPNSASQELYDVRYVNSISPTIKADGGISIHFSMVKHCKNTYCLIDTNERMNP